LVPGIGVSLPINSTLTNGAVTFNATLQTIGSQTITSTDTVSESISGTSNTITVNEGNPPLGLKCAHETLRGVWNLI
jgi:hypothetical protein